MAERRVIIKVQVSLASSDGVRRALIYNEDRTLQTEVVLEGGIAKLMGRRAKAYFSARVTDEGVFIGGEVGAQSW